MVAAFAGSRPPADAGVDGDGVVEALLAHLASAAAAADRGVRARAAATLAACLNAQPADAELSEALADKLAAGMAARLTDRAPAVRAAAAAVLARLADPGEAGDYAGDPVTAAYLKLLRTERHKDVRRAAVACVPPCSASLPALLARTRDVDVGVRRAVYVVLADKVPLGALPCAARAALAARGLRDRAPAVAAAAAALLVRWLDAGCGGDVGALLAALDVESHADEAEAALRALHAARRLHPAPLARAAAAAGAGLHRPHGSPPMTPEEALLWRVVCGVLGDEGAERGRAAASATGAVAAAAAASAADALSALEAALPPTVAHLCALVRDAAASGDAAGLFAAAQLARLVADSADVGDEAGRAAAADLLASLLADAAGPAGCDAAWADALAGLARATHAAPAEVAPPALVSIALRLPAPADRDAVAGDAGAWRGCLGAASILLRCILPARAPPDALGPPGTSLETVADLGPALILPALAHADARVRADAASAAGLLALAAPDAATAAALAACLRAAVAGDEAVVVGAAVRALADVALVRGPRVADGVVGGAVDDGGADASSPAAGPSSLSRSPTPHSPDRRPPPPPTALELLTSTLPHLDSDEADAVDAGEAAAEGAAKLLLHRGAAESGSGIPDAATVPALAALLRVVASSGDDAAPRARQALAVFFPLYAAHGARARARLAAAALAAARTVAIATGKAAPAADVLRFAADSVAGARSAARSAARAARATLPEPPSPAAVLDVGVALLEEAARVRGAGAAARPYAAAASALACALPLDATAAGDIGACLPGPPAVSSARRLRAAAHAAAAALPPTSVAGRAVASLARALGRSGGDGADDVAAALEEAALVAGVEGAGASLLAPFGVPPGALPFAADAAAASSPRAPAPRGRRAAAAAASGRVRAAAAGESESESEDPISDSGSDAAGDENAVPQPAPTPAPAAKSPTPAPEAAATTPARGL